MGALQHKAPSETVTAKRREQEIETQESGGEEACHLGGGARERHDVGRNHGDRGLLEPLRLPFNDGVAIDHRHFVVFRQRGLPVYCQRIRLHRAAVEQAVAHVEPVGRNLAGDNTRRVKG